jgi:hypothetical protein
MSTRIERKFKCGFVLEEASIIKIDEIIKSRLKVDRLNYNISTTDLAVYDSNSFEELLQQENTKGHLISEVRIHTYYSDKHDFKLVFNKWGVNLEISAEDKDLLRLLQSDLESFLKSNVLNKYIIRIDSWLWPTIAFSVWLLVSIVFISYLEPFAKKEMPSIGSNASIEEKINYLLLTSGKPANNVSPIAALAGTGSLLLILFGFPKIYEWVFPSNRFMLGRYAYYYNKRQKLLSKIFWGIIVGFGISIMTSLIIR